MRRLSPGLCQFQQQRVWQVSQRADNSRFYREKNRFNFSCFSDHFENVTFFAVDVTKKQDKLWHFCNNPFISNSTIFQNAVVVRRALKLPLLPESATQEEINKSIFTWDFKYMRYTIVEETDTEPGNIKIILLKSSEGFKIINFIKSFPS